VRRETQRRLARLGAGRVTPEAVRAAGAALDRGEQPVGKAADLVRYMRVFLLCAEAQSIGGGEVTDDVVAQLQRDSHMRFQPAELDRAREALAEWNGRDGNGSRV
jgi:hypothetical protein